MIGLTGFVRRGFCLAAVALLVVAGAVGAQTKYVVSAGTASEMFTVKLNGTSVIAGKTGTSGVPLMAALDTIRTRAGGGEVEISFGEGGGGVQIGTKTIHIERNAGVNPRWGKVTVSGEIVWSGRMIGGADSSALYLSADSGTFGVNVSCNMSGGSRLWNGSGIRLGANVVLSVDACTLSNVGGAAVYCDADNNNRVRINGGKFSSETGVVVGAGCEAQISDGEFESEGNGVVKASNKLTIRGGTFKTASDDYAVYALGNLDINGGKFESAKTAVYSMSDVKIVGGEFIGGSGDAVYAEGSLDVNGGRFGSSTRTVYSRGDVKIVGGEFMGGSGCAVYAGGNLDVIGGKFESSGRAVYSRGKAKIVGGDFKGGSNYAVYAYGGLSVDGSKFVSTKTGAVYSNGDFTIVKGEFSVDSGTALRVSGVGEIKDSKVKTTKGGTALLVAGGEALASANSEFVNASEDDATIQLSGGSVKLEDVTIKNSDRNGRAALITSASSKFMLSGSNSPNVIGAIASRFAGAISVDSKFRPGTKTYTLEPVGGACVDNAVAVSGGGAYRDNFVYENKYYTLSKKDNDIVVNLKIGVDLPNYVVTGDTIAGFVASVENKDSGNTVIGRGAVIGSVMDSIRINADGRPCGIRFGDSSSVLNVGQVSAVSFTSGAAGAQWGRITLSGKMSSAKSGRTSYTLYINGGVSVESSMDNPSALNHRGSVYVGAGSEYVHTGGNLCSAIYNDGGDVTITGGTIGSDTLNDYAVNISNSGRTVISGNAEIITASPNGAVYIGKEGYLYLYGGKVSSYVARTGDYTAKAIVVYAGDGSGNGAGTLEMCGSPVVEGLISLPGGYVSPVIITAGPEYTFNPPKNDKYRIAMPAWHGDVAVKNGAGFSRSFVLDTVGNTNFKFAVNGNDLVAAGESRTVSFSLNGALDTLGPEAIKVIKGGTIGELAKPSTERYISKIGGYRCEDTWYIRSGISTTDNSDQMNTPFRFGVGDEGTPVENDEVLTLRWTNISAFPNSVLEPSRDLPTPRPAETAAIAPIAAAPGSLTAGPSPVSSSSVGTVSFFRSGVSLKDGKLFIYDASGSMVATVSVKDPSGSTGRRPIAKWNLQDAKGRKVAEGTYVARGVITTKAGKTERVSVLVSVQR